MMLHSLRLVCGDSVMTTDNNRLMLVVTLFISLLCHVSSSPIQQGSRSCHHVHQMFPKSVNNKHISSTISSLIPGKDICPYSSTNCCHGLQHAIEYKATNDFMLQMSSNVAYFQEEFVLIEQRIRQRFLSIFNKTLERFNQNYSHSKHIIVANNKLFDYIANYFVNSSYKESSQQQSRIEFHVARLFESIFITELQKSKTYPTGYVSCLQTVFNDNNILATIQATSTKQIVNVIETSSLILQSLDLTSELLNRSKHVKLSAECIYQLAANSHCAHCSAISNVRPCFSTCRNTMATCFATTQLGLIDDAWKSLVDTVEQLVNSVLIRHNPEFFFDEYHTFIDKAIEIIRANSEDIAAKAKIACGSPKRYYRSIPIENSYDFYSSSAKPVNSQFIAFSQSLYISLETLSHTMIQHRDVFSNLTSKFCNQHSDSECWDGRSVVNSYQGHVKPAIPVNTASNSSIVDILDQIKHIYLSTEKLKAEEIQEVVSNKEYNLSEGSGSGYSPDDEDFNGPEHSGNGSYDPIETSTEINSNDITFEIDPKKNTNDNRNDPFDLPEENELDNNSVDTGSSANHKQLNNCILLLALLLTFRFGQQLLL